MLFVYDLPSGSMVEKRLEHAFNTYVYLRSMHFLLNLNLCSVYPTHFMFFYVHMLVKLLVTIMRIKKKMLHPNFRFYVKHLL